MESEREKNPKNDDRIQTLEPKPEKNPQNDDRTQPLEPEKKHKMRMIMNIEIRLLSKKNYLSGYMTLEVVHILKKSGNK